MSSIAEMLDDMLWGAVAPFFYCGCISGTPEFLLVCCSGMDNEKGIYIIHLLVPGSLQVLYPCFYLL